MRVDRAGRQVLRHALDEPQRQAQRTLPRGTVLGVLGRLLRDVELERVHELVAEHVVGLARRAGERQHDAALEHLGEAAGALADLAGRGVGLAEVRMAGVQDQRLAAAQLVVEQVLEAVVPALHHDRGLAGAGVFLFVGIDVEVLGLEHAEVLGFVADLVAAEVLGVGGAGGEAGQQAASHREGVFRTTFGWHRTSARPWIGLHSCEGYLTAT
jgi:hypothetical protein